MRRVVLTGVGPVAPNGIGRDAFWDALMAGRSGIGEIQGFDASGFPCRIAGEVNDFHPEHFMDPRRARRMGRFSQFAVAAARLASEDASLDLAQGGKERGLALGVSNNALEILEREIDTFQRRGGRKTSPAALGAVFPHAAASEASIACGCQGPVLTVSAGCASGCVAIGHACEEIRQGRAEVMLAGGADASITPFTLSCMCSAHVLPPDDEDADPELASRPFDAMRRGGVLSEGAGMVVIESLEHALARRARIYGEVLSYSGNAEAHGVLDIATDDSFLERAMRGALQLAGLRPTDVDYICAHGPGDVCDVQEVRAIKRVFGQHAHSLALSSIKSMIGNPFASAGPLQIITVALALIEQRVPPTTNLATPDPECDLDCVPNRARMCRIRVALVNSHGFGGANHCIAMGRYPRASDRLPA